MGSMALVAEVGYSYLSDLKGHLDDWRILLDVSL